MEAGKGAKDKEHAMSQKQGARDVSEDRHFNMVSRMKLSHCVNLRWRNAALGLGCVKTL
jgi:hypothetical protein